MNSQPTTGSLSIGMVLSGRYEILEALDRGGMGEVYLANQLGIDRRVVIKAVSAGRFDEEATQLRFRREAALLQRITHPNVVDILDVGKTEAGGTYLVLEYLRGMNLRRLLEVRGRLHEPEVFEIACQLLGATAQAHSLGIVHRDIKPSNIIQVEQVGAPSLVKLIDFGISRSADPDPEVGFHTLTGFVVGTPEYMSPEHLRGETTDARSDLYSIGMVMCELATGYRPRSGGLTYEVLTGRLQAEPIAMPVWLARQRLGQVIERATQPHPDNRYRDASEMYKALTGESLQGVSLDDFGDSSGSEACRPLISLGMAIVVAAGATFWMLGSTV